MKVKVTVKEAFGEKSPFNFPQAFLRDPPAPFAYAECRCSKPRHRIIES